MQRKELNVKVDGLVIKEDDTKIYIYSSWYNNRYTVLRLFGGKDYKLKSLFIKMSYTETVFYKFFLPEVIMLFKALLRMDNKYGIRVDKVEEILTYIDTTTKVTEIVDYNTIDRKFKFKILDHQRPIFDNYKNVTQVMGYRGMLIEAAVGSGKAQPLYSRIRTPNGWTTMGNIQKGDMVVSVDGTYSTVTDIFPQEGEREVLKFIFEDGRYTDVDTEHLWTCTIDGKKCNYHSSGIYTLLQENAVIEMPVIEDKTFNSKSNTIFNPLIDIPPTLFGFLMASSSIFPTFTLFSVDDYNYELAQMNSLALYSKIDTHYTTMERYSSYLHSCNMWDTSMDSRKIPNLLLYNTADVRKDIITGLETYLQSNKLLEADDGYNILTIPHMGNCRLKDNIIELYRSLGYLVTEETIITHMDTSFNQPDIATKLRVKKVDKIRLVSIQKVGKTNTKCIAIDHPSKLYITDDYIVTHNTFSSLALSEGLGVDNVIIVCPLPTVEKVWIKSIYDDSENCYKEKQSYVLAADGIYRQEKFIICHYEALDKLHKIVPAISRKKVAIIVDECHNFATSTSKRTELLISLVNSFNNVDVMLLSGTPIKASYKEIGNILKLISVEFNSSHVEKRFHGIYKTSNYTVTEFLNNRYQKLSTKIAKESIGLKPMDTMYIKIPMDKNISNKYTLETIAKELREFMEKRLKELEDNKEHYHNEYRILYNKAISLNNGKISKTELLQYERNVSIIQKARDYTAIKDVVKYCNQFENTYLLSVLHGEDKSKFRELKTIYKYPVLKVIGEGLGQVILRKRIDCHVELVKHLKLNNIVDGTNKKTIIFSSYIEVCDAAIDTCKKYKYKPLEVYGSTTKNLNTTVNSFLNDKKANPLVTTYKSLSTGVPLTVANTIVCVDMPYRMYIYEQAIGRVWRLGQDTKVLVYILQLDTGDLPNINTRNIDIIKFFKEEVERITGTVSNIDLDSSNIIENGVTTDSADYINITKDELTLLASKEKALKPYFYDTSTSVINRW